MSRRKAAALGALLLLPLLLGGCKVAHAPDAQGELPAPTSGTAERQAEAAAAARGYLALIDAKQYDKTWEQAGSALKAMTSQFMWTSALKAASLLGRPDARTIEGFGFTSQVDPGGPIGDYVLVQFKTRSGATTLTEKVVMQKEQGTWKIVGYVATQRAEFGTGN
jgi:hypothetical protein